jgi:hypothetical protein
VFFVSRLMRIDGCERGPDKGGEGKGGGIQVLVVSL